MSMFNLCTIVLCVIIKLDRFNQYSFNNTSNNIVYHRVMYDVMRINAKELISKVDELIAAYIKHKVWNLCDDDPNGTHAM